jgi:hypothetical protein
MRSPPPLGLCIRMPRGDIYIIAAIVVLVIVALELARHIGP